MPSKKFNKICTVCGEKAIGFNFCAISCESCKAFFRRNASKLDEYNCPFNDSCKITQVTRKFCRKCRLKKCFDVGMKQEWILTEEEKELRRIKIETNKKGNRQVSDTSGTPCDVDPSASQAIGTNGSDANDSGNGDNNISDEEIIKNLMQIEEFLTETNTESTVHELNDQSLSLLSFTSCVNEQTQSHALYETRIERIGEESNSSDDSQNISDITYQKAVELELSVIPIPKPVDGSKELNEVECNRLTEIFNATLTFRRPYPTNNVVIGKADDLSKYFVERLEAFSQKFVSFSKSLSSFGSLCQNDQIALIKSAVIEGIFMRTALYFDSVTEQWNFIFDDNSSITFKLDVLLPLYQGDKSFYQLFRNYSHKICKEWDNDTFIIDLLLPIILFDPNRPNIVHKEPIRLQQLLYMYLLQRYLQLKYSDDCEYKVKFLRILDVIQDLQQLQQIQKKHYRQADLSVLGPLSREILDINGTTFANPYMLL